MQFEVDLERALMDAAKAQMSSAMSTAVTEAVNKAIRGTHYEKNSFQARLAEQIERGVTLAFAEINLTEEVRVAVLAHVQEHRGSLIAQAVNGISEEMTRRIVDSFARNLQANMAAAPPR